MSESDRDRKNNTWKIGLMAGGAAIIAGIGYYLGTQSHEACSSYTNNDSNASEVHDTDNCKNEKCSICLSKLKPVQRLSCGHTFHHDCISKWLPENATCPICRQGQK